MLAAALLTAGASLATASPQSHKTLLVVGDSWGSFGPSWHSFQDMFDRHGVNATVKSAARGGTTACQWAQKDTILVEAAEKLFPGWWAFCLALPGERPWCKIPPLTDTRHTPLSHARPLA